MAANTTAPLFAALGDATRLSLVTTLSQGAPRSIAQLTQDTPMTRQAVTKHLKVLEGVGIVRSIKKGRETMYEFSPEPIDGLKEYLDRISEHWDVALLRLKRFVEE
jgi:DNA-binding transcriptional ArsR family regulator